MTKLQKTTFIVVISDILALCAYDVWVAYVNHGPSATISWMLSWSFQQWWGVTAVLALGILIGHLVAQDGKLSLDGTIK